LCQEKSGNPASEQLFREPSLDPFNLNEKCWGERFNIHLHWNDFRLGNFFERVFKKAYHRIAQITSGGINKQVILQSKFEKNRRKYIYFYNINLFVIHGPNLRTFWSKIYCPFHPEFNDTVILSQNYGHNSGIQWLYVKTIKPFFVVIFVLDSFHPWNTLGVNLATYNWQIPPEMFI
jgi:hypothetical protein